MKARMPTAIRFLVRAGIVLTFVLVGVAALSRYPSPSYDTISSLLPLRMFGILFLVAAALSVWNTVRRERLNGLAVVLWFMYTGAIITAAARLPSPPFHVMGVYLIAGFSLIAEAVFPIGSGFYGVRK